MSAPADDREFLDQKARDTLAASGKTDLLLRFFDSQFFDEWIALTWVAAVHVAAVWAGIQGNLAALYATGISTRAPLREFKTTSATGCTRFQRPALRDTYLNYVSSW